MLCGARSHLCLERLALLWRHHWIARADARQHFAADLRAAPRSSNQSPPRVSRLRPDSPFTCRPSPLPSPAMRNTGTLLVARFWKRHVPEISIAADFVRDGFGLHVGSNAINATRVFPQPAFPCRHSNSLNNETRLFISGFFASPTRFEFLPIADAAGIPGNSIGFGIPLNADIGHPGSCASTQTPLIDMGEMRHMLRPMPPLGSVPPAPARRVRLFRNGRNQAIRIPREFELEAEEATMRREGSRLIIEPIEIPHGLCAVLDTLEPLDDEFPDVDDTLAPLDDIEL